MLNFRLSVGLEVQQFQYPILFDRKNICIHCGAEDSLIFVDKFGHETKKEIYPFDHIKCTKCGRNYSIMWQRDVDSGRMYPTAVDLGIRQEFLNLVNLPKIKKNGEKEL